MLGVGWYDWFSLLYDPALEAVYRRYRRAAAEALDLSAGMTVLDVPCGTGQSFKALYDRVQPGGAYVGVDLSSGMLARARLRGRSKQGAYFVEADAGSLDGASLVERGLPEQVDRLHIFLGLTTFDGWSDAFQTLWALLRPGGRCVIVDVYAEQPGLQGRIVELMAQATLRRRAWEPLAAVAEGFDRQVLSTDAVHGGELWLACGRKPDAGIPKG